MKNLLKIELIKTAYHPTFWAIVLLHALLFCAIVAVGAIINFEVHDVQILKIFSGSYMWGTAAWIASWFNLLLAILLIVLTGNELQYNTFRRQVLDGLTRNRIILGKLALIVGLSVYVVVLVTLTGLVVALADGAPWPNSFFRGFGHVLVLGVQATAYMTLAMLLALVFRNIALSIVAYLIYFVVVEPIIRVFTPSSVDAFFPMKLISNLTPMPNFMGMAAEELSALQDVNPSTIQQLQAIPEGTPIGLSVAVCLAYIALFAAASYLTFRYRDL